MRYEWDKTKSSSNQDKHGVRFADAVGVFEDINALSCEDFDAQGEQRFVTIGMDFLGRVLTVAHLSPGQHSYHLGTSGDQKGAIGL